LLSPPLPKKKKVISIEQESLESWDDPLTTKETKESKKLFSSHIVRPNYFNVILENKKKFLETKNPKIDFTRNSGPNSKVVGSRGHTELDRLSADLSSIGQIEGRMTKYGRIREEDKEYLLKILSPEFEDPTWMEGTLLHELF
jgi:hypothetical protein